VSSDSVNYQGMLPDTSRYEERYQLTGQAAVGLAAGLGSVGLGVLWRSHGISAAAVILLIPVVSSVAGVILALPVVAAVAGRMTALRADYAGITLGAEPDNLMFLGRRAVFASWAEIDQVILHRAVPRGQGAAAPVRRITIRRREGAVALTPGAAGSLSRRITGWRLDAGRLAAVIAVVAPGIPIIDARTDADLPGASRDR
jgi:hypothetical protein